MDLEEQFKIEPNIIQLIPASIAWKYFVLPYKVDSNEIQILSTTFLTEKSINELETILNKKILTLNTEESTIKKLLEQYYRKTNDGNVNNVSINNPDRFLQDLLKEAKELNSSDIHIEIGEGSARVRIRIDGHLIEKYSIDLENYPAFINKIKILSKLDISEKRLPQDGRIKYKYNEVNIDLRVSVLPTLFGEKIVLRILNSDSSELDIRKTGMSPNQLDLYLNAIKKPSGIILFSGPTGSGKTTTLYSTLKYLNNTKTNIITVEDPIEYTLPGINQVQLKEKIGLTFPAALRSFLRQDPDIIMVGEIRDKDTAEIAIRAALTGHLVFSTIHTNSSWGTITRLIDMGVPSYLLSTTLNSSIAQRLLRKLCKYCKVRIQSNYTEFPNHIPKKDIPKEIFDPVGCSNCHHTGYHGRIALFENLIIDESLSKFIRENKREISDWMKENKVTTLSKTAFDLVCNGVTSIEEAYPILMN